MEKVTIHMMAASIFPEYPPQTTIDQQEFLLSSIKNWSVLNGLATRPSPTFVPTEVDSSGSLATTAPVTFFPSLFPRNCFDEARFIQQAYNQLYAAIARDRTWLKEIVEEYADIPTLHVPYLFYVQHSLKVPYVFFVLCRFADFAPCTFVSSQ